MPHKPNFTAELTNKKSVEKAAAFIGCTQTRGKAKNYGSIRVMLEEIGQGEILLMFHQYDEPQKMLEIAAKIRLHGESLNSDPLDDFRCLLVSLAAALENAAKVKEFSNEYEIRMSMKSV